MRFSAIALAAALAFGAPAMVSAAPLHTPLVAVAPQYDTTHVYVAPEDVEAFVTAFIGTFGGKSTKQVIATVTPTPSSTSSQLLQTPVGTVSLFGFKTPVPYPFGSERTGYLVTDLEVAINAARETGADVIVEPFSDPIGRDAVIQWPGGVRTQLYWHTRSPSYPPFEAVPENRVYVSAGAVSAFLKSFLDFSHGAIITDDTRAPGQEIGRPGDTYRRVRVDSAFGKLTVLVTDGHLPFPFGRETTGYAVTDLNATLTKAKSLGVKVLVEPQSIERRTSAMVEFPGGYIAEIHTERPQR